MHGSYIPRFRYTLALALAAVLALGCVTGGTDAARRHVDSLRFYRLLQQGNEAYARKTSLRSFQESLIAFDSAAAIADLYADPLMHAEALFARGRVYDAWDRDQAATVALFEEAARRFADVPGKRPRHLYVRHLVAHAYEKGGDSAAAAGILRQMLGDLRDAPPDTLALLPFTVEMALIATEIRAYPLADSLLRLLTRRELIRNDPETYDYLNHYYLAQSRLDIHWRGRRPSFYLDSLQKVVKCIASPVEQQFYQTALAKLAAAAGLPGATYDAFRKSMALAGQLNTGQAATRLRETIVQSELAQSRKMAAYEAHIEATRRRNFWLLAGLLGIITLLAVLVFRKSRRYKAQTKRLAQVNAELDEKIAQVELLNKEIQHRIKNNLHMIYSLLSMQERRADNPQTVSHLQAARLRVESVAALHDQLLHGRDGLNFTEYLKRLIASVVACLADEKQVITHITATPIEARTTSYFALSLILNEWVTNSVKYARPAKPMLEISVDIRRIGNDICIRYSDNGQPPAPGPQPALTGLGTQIIALLCRQLGAAIETSPDHPYHYELCMPYGA